MTSPVDWVNVLSVIEMFLHLLKAMIVPSSEFELSVKVLETTFTSRTRPQSIS